ncbi:cobalamin biosynthesis protein [Novosphingobium sp. BL-8H]|uniref:cobalamin biosynthesis protein n=1 Tax=Novosphingobium sp. BL-8H TaxID=3127640 RepID=UPI003756FC6F
MIVAGFGFRAQANVHSLCSAYQLAREGMPPITHVATLAEKAHLLAELSNLLGLPLIAVPQERLAQARTLTASAASRAARGVDSVAEASALAALGADTAVLLARRHISRDRMATCAIASGVHS